jgi:hypothetical protein
VHRRCSSGPLAAALGAVLVAFLSLDGCTAEKPGSDRAHATPDLLDAGAVPIASRCQHAEPPSRPNVDGGGGDADLVFAVTHASYGTSSASVDDAGRPLYLSYGFDLDDTCTDEGQLDSCLEPLWADAGHMDGPRGVDNAAGEFLAQEFPTQPDQGTVNDPTYATVILRIRGYNNQRDDDQVDLAAYEGDGVVPRDDGGTSLQWDGHDAWMILRDTLAPPFYTLDQPMFHDDRAYVTGGVLVAHVPQASWPTGLAVAHGSLHIVQQVVLAGNLVQVGQQWELQHLVVGLRDSVQDILSISAVILQPGGLPLCASNDLYQAYKRRLCSFVDISAEPDSPANSCDALSGGSILEARQAVLGGVAESAELPVSTSACAPGVDPNEDTCGP